MTDFEDKVVLVTGGTSGIGEASVIEFASLGAKVIVTGRSVEKWSSGMAAKENNYKFKPVFFKCDNTDDILIEQLKNYIESQYGKLDVLFNNAGIYPVEKPLQEIQREDLAEIFDTNIIGTMMITKNMLNLLIKAGGVIINNASIAGMDAFVSGGSWGYTGSKSAIIKFTKMLAKKYGREIRVNAICPGVIKTPIFKSFDEEKRSIGIPMQRTGMPIEVAKVVAFLASEDASYVNGAVVPIDGGQSL